ncbi:MAG: hypothetical protein QOH73_1531 [Gaiellaceae bacterium]|nr:hypothetical protein [Gaiellaceae bacterium]
MSVYRNGIVLLGAAMIVLGVAMLVRTALAGGGVGLLLGVLFIGLGAARIYLVFRRRPR